jgi:DNA end-binding protein Ku
MEISQFVKLEEIDPVFFETSYFVVPEPGAEKSYSLLVTALRRAGYVGIASVAMHRREHMIVVRPGKHGLLAHTLFYADEVRSSEEVRADPTLVAPRELEMAGLLVDALAGEFDPSKYQDTYRQNLNALIEGKLGSAGDAPREERPRGAPVIDMMQALQQSLDKLKKPVQTEKKSKGKATHRPTAKEAG